MSHAWRALLTRVSETSGVGLEVIEHAYPAPLDELWERPDMGCVFMCGYPWALRRDRPRLLAAPVPSPARYGNRPFYFTDFVVRTDSPFQTLEDTFGRRLAYSIENSHSGYNAARYHLLAYRTPARRALYAETLGPFVSQRRVLDAVLDGRADVAPLATTEPAPIPPLVASPGISEDTCSRLTATLLEAHQDPTLAPSMKALLLARFVEAAPAGFEVFLDRQRAAEAAGYPALA